MTSNAVKNIFSFFIIPTVLTFLVYMNMSHMCSDYVADMQTHVFIASGVSVVTFIVMFLANLNVSDTIDTRSCCSNGLKDRLKLQQSFLSIGHCVSSAVMSLSFIISLLRSMNGIVFSFMYAFLFLAEVYMMTVMILMLTRMSSSISSLGRAKTYGCKRSEDCD